MNRPRLSARLGPLSLIALASACAAPEAEGYATIASLQAPIQDGTVARNQPNVVGLQSVVGQSGQSVQTLLCTGSLIAPNLVLTARHCIARVDAKKVECGKTPFSAPLSPRDVFVTTADRMSDDLDDYLEASEVLVPDEGNDVCGFDVALILLRNRVPEAVARPLEPRLDGAVAVGEAYRAVGFGATGTDDTSTSGTRRERSGLSASCIEGGGCSLSREREWEGQAGVCEGDSGGPAIDAEGRVVGVASRSNFSPERECLTPVYGAVSGWRDWIREVAKRAAQEGAYEPATWVTTVSAGGTSGSGQTTGGGGNSGTGGGGDGGENDASNDDGDDGCALRAPAAGAGATSAWLLGAALALAGRARRRRRG